MPFIKGHTLWKHPKSIKHQFKKGNISPMIKNRRIETCLVCKKPFKTTKFGVEKRHRKYCSQKCMGLNQIGNNNPNWKGGTIIRSRIRHGVVEKRYCKRVPGHPRANIFSPYVKVAVLNMEEKIGRYLFPNEIVHHINHNSMDDRVENLMLLQSNKEHRKLHRKP